MFYSSNKDKCNSHSIWLYLFKEKRHQKAERDPKKILENLKQQEEMFKELEETQREKVKEMKEKIAWKNVLQKAEGEKIKDDPILLKKSIKKLVIIFRNMIK